MKQVNQVLWMIGEVARHARNFESQEKTVEDYLRKVEGIGRPTRPWTTRITDDDYLLEDMVESGALDSELFDGQEEEDDHVLALLRDRLTVSTSPIEALEALSSALMMNQIKTQSRIEVFMEEYE